MYKKSQVSQQHNSHCSQDISCKAIVHLLLFLFAGLCCSASVADEHQNHQTESSANSYNRIVSIGGAITETIYALNEGHRIVGTDTTSYYPEAANNTPKVGYQRSLSAEGILSLKPDVIIASDEAGPVRVLAQLEATGINLLKVATPDDLKGVTDNITRIGGWLQAETAARQLSTTINKQAAALQQIRINAEKIPAVLFILQHAGGSPMVAGANTSAASIIHLAGGRNAISEFEGYKPLTPEALLTSKPDSILTTTMGLEQVGGIGSMLEIPGLKLTPAGKNQDIIAMDGLLLLGFGPRTPNAALELNRQLSHANQ